MPLVSENTGAKAHQVPEEKSREHQQQKCPGNFHPFTPPFPAPHRFRKIYHNPPELETNRDFSGGPVLFSP
jgi:hypothetical protein